MTHKPDDDAALREIVTKHTVVGGYPDTMGIARDAYALAARLQSQDGVREAFTDGGGYTWEQCIDCDGTGSYPSGAECKSCEGSGSVPDYATPIVGADLDVFCTDCENLDAECVCQALASPAPRDEVTVTGAAERLDS